MLKRQIESTISNYLKSGNRKIFFIWGPRRSGKTTLLGKISQQLKVPVFNFDLLTDREYFVPQREILAKLASENKVILIDEVQNYPESTLALKILFDEFKVKVIATGSSELRQKTKTFDSLAGRYQEHFCLPLSVGEIALNVAPKEYQKASFFKKTANQLQIFGAFPEVYVSRSKETEKIDLLRYMFEAYVLKDIINIYELKNMKLARDILLKIALQLGSEVSLREIANSLQANVATVSSYIEIFIKNYILIPLPSFKTNLRRAVSENRKYYFYDLGLRNILVQDFRPLTLRPDRGGLFENFIVSEVEKMRKNDNLKLNLYFYREYGGREVDLVLEDYRKKYWCLEMKTKARPAERVFPLKHKLQMVDINHYYEVLQKVI